MNCRLCIPRFVRRRGWTACLLSLLLTIAADPGRTQTPDWKLVHEITMRGINLLYDLKMEEAGAAFDSVIAMAPGDPRGRFFKSMIHFWTFTVQNDPASYAAFMSMSDTVVDLCERLIDRDGSDAVARFYLGGMHGYRGMAYQMQGSFLKAVLEGRAGYTDLEQAVEMRPDLYDAQMGFGLFRYLVAKIPAALSWGARLIGFDGDLEGGLQSLRAAAEKGVYTRSEATFFLSQFLWTEHRHEEALSLMKSLIRRFPDNTLFLVLCSSWELRQGNYQAASDRIRKAAELNRNKKVKYGEEFIHSTRGTVAYAFNDFGTARRDFDSFLAETKHADRIQNYTYYRIAVARDVTGDRAGAVDVCRKMRVEEGHPDGSYTLRKARELERSPLTQAEVLMIMGGNASDRKAYDSAAHYFRAALALSGTSPDLRVRALYGLQQVVYEEGDDARAVDIGNQIIGLKPAAERWVIPHAYFKLAQSYRRLGNSREASHALSLAAGFEDYDFQSSLRRRVEEEMKKMKGP